MKTLIFLIKYALENGWNAEFVNAGTNHSIGGTASYIFHEDENASYLTDPLFWVALGMKKKAAGEVVRSIIKHE